MAELRRFHIYVCVRVAVRGIPLYSRNTARRHVCVYTCACILKLSNQGNFTWSLVLGLSGVGFYIFILLNKYITFWGLYIWAIKNSKKKSKKVVKLDCFGLYNILGS